MIKIIPSLAKNAIQPVNSVIIQLRMIVLNATIREI